jgi:hypothetical protein
MKKNEFESGLIDAYKKVFEKYPSLQFLPVYSWGRYYKYECSGDPFESFPFSEYSKEGELCMFFLGIEVPEKFERSAEDHEEIFEAIDDTEIMCEIAESFWIQRKDAARFYHFDERAGRALVIVKENEDFTVETWECDSPE